MAADGLHARFSAPERATATGSTSAAAVAFERAAAGVSPTVDSAALASAAALGAGDHDFRAFTPTKTQHEVSFGGVSQRRWIKRGDTLDFEITADSFLRHMVRSLVGTMLERTRRVAASSKVGGKRRPGRRRRPKGSSSSLPTRAFGDWQRPVRVGWIVRSPTVLFDLDGTVIDSGIDDPRVVPARDADGARARDPRRGADGRRRRPGLEAQMRAFDPDQVDELVGVYREHNEPMHGELESFTEMIEVLLARSERRAGGSAS